MNRKLNVLFALSLTLAGVASAQDSTKAPVPLTEQVTNVQGQVDGLNEDYLATKATVDKLAHLKVGGYIQAQWQRADSSGIGSVAGGNFPTTANQRLQLRRVRLKTTYDAGPSQYIMEFEALPSGVSLKDAEVVLFEPWLKTFSFDVGFMDRPFGFEIPYSSSAHEAPERTRIYQTLFPGEKDLGAKLEANPGENMGFLQYLNLKVGLYTGTAGASAPGTAVTLAPTVVKSVVDSNPPDTARTTLTLANGKTAPAATGDEIDSTMDLIGRIGFKAPFNDLGLAIDGGFSFYMGKSLSSGNDSVYQMAGDSLAPTIGNKNKTFDRKVMGLDAQVYYTIPVIGDILGGSSLRGEYLWGQMPGTLGSSKPYGTSASAVGPDYPNSYMAVRNFMGWYISYIQNFGSIFQTVVKYDVYDPNTDVSGASVGVGTKGNRLSANDLKYTTLGFGGIFYWSNVKLTAYYDMVTNEKAGGTLTNKVAANWGADLPDNVLTLRAQVKF